MLKEEKELRKFIKRSWDGSLTKVSEKGQPDKYQNTDRVMLTMVTALVRAVREDCAKVAESFHRNPYPSTTSCPMTVPQEIAYAIRRGK